MQFQRQSVRIAEEGHLLSRVVISAYWLCGNPQIIQFSDNFLYIFYRKCKMPQAARFGISHTLWRILNTENLQFSVAKPQIQFRILFICTIVFPDETQGIMTPDLSSSL